VAGCYQAARGVRVSQNSPIGVANGAYCATRGPRRFSPFPATTPRTFRGGGSVAVDLPNDRVFFLQDSGIAVYQASNFVYLGTIPIGEYAGGKALVRWGPNGLAYISGSYVVLVMTDFLPD
jgi:hypothetical protein